MKQKNLRIINNYFVIMIAALTIGCSESDINADVKSIEDIDICDVSLTGIKGKHLFYTNCSACHSNIVSDSISRELFVEKIKIQFMCEDGKTFELDSCEQLELLKYFEVYGKKSTY